MNYYYPQSSRVSGRSREPPVATGFRGTNHTNNGARVVEQGAPKRLSSRRSRLLNDALPRRLRPENVILLDKLVQDALSHCVQRCEDAPPTGRDRLVAARTPAPVV